MLSDDDAHDAMTAQNEDRAARRRRAELDREYRETGIRPEPECPNCEYPLTADQYADQDCPRCAERDAIAAVILAHVGVSWISSALIDAIQDAVNRDLEEY
jgi:hypothetical protein